MVETVNNLLNTTVSVFDSVTKTKDNSRMRVLTLKDVLLLGNQYKNQINYCRQFSGKETPEMEQHYKDCKRGLPVFTTSVLCGNGVKDITHMNNILCVDIDEQDNPGMDPEKVKEDLITSIPSIFYVSKSVGGRGVFGLMSIEPTDDFKGLFNLIKNQIYYVTGYIIDKSCCNPNRLRIISYDENPRMKDPEEYVILSRWLEKPDRPRKYKELLEFSLPKRQKDHEFIDLLDDDDFCVSCVNYCIDRLGLQTTDYQNWISHLGSLTSLGMEGELLGIKLSQQSPKYTSDDDVNKTMRSLSGKGCQRHFLLRYFKMCKDSLGKDWVQVIRSTI
jgi:hypothetical protein